MPIVEPTTDSCRKNTRVSSAGGASPEVAPETTSVPPGRSDRIEWPQVALPTVSMTASTRSSSRAPVSNACSAPSRNASSRFRSERLVTHIRTPAALPSTVSAVATPPPAPWTSTVIPGVTPPRVNSIRYAVSHAVGRHAACSNDSSDGLGSTLRLGTATRCAPGSCRGECRSWASTARCCSCRWRRRCR